MDYPTPLGSFSFDEDRNPVHEPVVQIVLDGKFQLLTEDTAAQAYQ
jgi:branched-chain amino acid transport system substrate-binding protein